MTAPYTPQNPAPVFRRALSPGAAKAVAGGKKPDPDAASAPPAKATSRLNKRMAELGMCSRREADEWVANGWVKVNGVVAEMGLQVLPTDTIDVDRAAKGKQANQVTILINKPMGYVSSQAEDGHEPAVTLFTPQNRWVDDNARFFWNHSQLPGLAPCGRLDIDSIGLLVMTQDGRIARQLIGEDSVMEKEYLVRVEYYADGQISQHHIANPHPLQAHHLQANLLTHAADLALFAFGQHKAQLLGVLPVHFGAFQRLVVQTQTEAQSGQQGGREGALHI